MTEGRALPPTSAFAGDDGSAPPLLAAALAIEDAQQRLEAVVEALRTERVLVPVVARLDEMDEPGEHGVAAEKSAHAAMVTVGVPDGRAANQPDSVVTFSPPSAALLPGASVRRAVIGSPASSDAVTSDAESFPSFAFASGVVATSMRA